MDNSRISCLLMVPLVALCAAVACAQPADLGTVDFPTSGSPQAQAWKHASCGLLLAPPPRAPHDAPAVPATPGVRCR